jgi:hypothetical protein
VISAESALHSITAPYGQCYDLMTGPVHERCQRPPPATGCLLVAVGGWTAAVDQYGDHQVGLLDPLPYTVIPKLAYITDACNGPYKSRGSNHIACATAGGVLSLLSGVPVESWLRICDGPPSSDCCMVCLASPHGGARPCHEFNST